MNLTLFTTLFALVGSAAVASASVDAAGYGSVEVPDVQYTDAGPDANSRQLREFTSGLKRTNPAVDDQAGLRIADPIPRIQSTDADAEGVSPELRSFSFGGRSGVGGSSEPTERETNVGTVRPEQGSKAGVSDDEIDDETAGFSLNPAIAPLVPHPGSSSPCRQVACWIAAPTEACALAAANKVQENIMRGRDTFHVEKNNATGIWALYGRTQFMPPNADTVAHGSCGGKGNFEVSNCEPGDEAMC